MSHAELLARAIRHMAAIPPSNYNRRDAIQAMIVEVFGLSPEQVVSRVKSIEAAART